MNSIKYTHRLAYSMALIRIRVAAIWFHYSNTFVINAKSEAALDSYNSFSSAQTHGFGHRVYVNKICYLFYKADYENCAWFNFFLISDFDAFDRFVSINCFFASTLIISIFQSLITNNRSKIERKAIDFNCFNELVCISTKSGQTKDGKWRIRSSQKFRESQ